jgi:hypothetical protein
MGSLHAETVDDFDLGEQPTAVEVAARSGNPDRRLRQRFPEGTGARRVGRVEHVSCTLQCQFKRLRPGRIVVEWQNPKAAQDLPDRLVVVRAAGISKMPADGRDKGPHVIVADPPAVDPSKEDRRRVHLPCPSQHILIGTGDLERSPLGRDGELMTPVGKIERWECARELLHDILEHRVAGRERNRAFDLHLQHGRLANLRGAADDHIIKGMALAGALEFDTLDRHTGQTARLRLCEHGQKIVRRNLPLEEGARRAA